MGYDARMRALLMSMVLAAAMGSASAQSPIDPDTFAGRKDIRTAELDQLWRTLGISGKIRETTVNGSKDTDESFNCGVDTGCDGQSFSPAWPLVAGGGEDMVVRISTPPLADDLSRFLVFHQQGAGEVWRLVDYLDLTYSHSARRRCRLSVRAGSDGWSSSPILGVAPDVTWSPRIGAN